MPMVKKFWVLTILLILIACTLQSKQQVISVETLTAGLSPALPIESERITPSETSLALSLNLNALTLEEYTHTQAPALTPLPPNSEALIQQVIRDLAHRLAVSPSSIEVISNRKTEIAQQDFKCETARGTEKFTLPAVRLVSEILIKVQDKQYRYLAWGPHLLFCGEYP
jgi:hypothetical protein